MNPIAALFVSMLGFASDQITKKLADAEFFDKEEEYFGGRVRLMRRTNKGFAMNRFAGQRKLVVGVSAAVFLLLTVVYALALADGTRSRMRLGLSLVVAGAAGNVYDRIFRGEVTDFINIPLLDKLVFNLADIYIVVGGLLAIAGELMTGKGL